MNDNQAQRNWKELYRDAKRLRALGKYVKAYASMFHAMRYRREAALERKLEAAQRTIEAQAAELAEYRKLKADIEAGVIVLEMPASDEEEA